MKFAINNLLFYTLCVFTNDHKASALRGGRGVGKIRRDLQSASSGRSMGAFKISGEGQGGAAGSTFESGTQQQMMVNADGTVPGLSSSTSTEPSNTPSAAPSSLPSMEPVETPVISFPVQVGGGNIVAIEVSDRSADLEAIYDVTFTNLWSATRHPPLYPSNAHWSPPVCVAHSSAYQMWSPGTFATPGVQSVAETGGTFALFNELDDAGDAIDGTIRGRVTFNSEEQSQTISELAIGPDHPFISTITMIAPSPDWFTGFYDLSPVSTMSGKWWSSFTVETYPFDAGTDSGTTYSARNAATNPAEEIFELTPESVPSSNVFLLDSETVLPVGQWTFVLRE